MTVMSDFDKVDKTKAEKESPDFQPTPRPCLQS